MDKIFGAQTGPPNSFHTEIKTTVHIDDLTDTALAAAAPSNPHWV